ncbi:hypothetical protein D1007_36528 [Hordeum vulgare]|nr:hypothetical protein D1007_36528 [Hordeum vulgare]
MTPTPRASARVGNMMPRFGSRVHPPRVPAASSSRPALCKVDALPLVAQCARPSRPTSPLPPPAGLVGHVRRPRSQAEPLHRPGLDPRVSTPSAPYSSPMHIYVILHPMPLLQPSNQIWPVIIYFFHVLRFFNYAGNLLITEKAYILHCS